MENETATSKASDDALSNSSQESPSTIVVNKEPFLHFDPKSKLSSEDQSAIFISLVALVKAEYPFDNALQDKAAQFLTSLEPKWDPRFGSSDKLVKDFAPSSDGSPSGFVESIVTLLSSPHLKVVQATFSFLCQTTRAVSPAIRNRLVESDIVSKVLATVQPHTLPIPGNETIINKLLGIISDFVCHTYQGDLIALGVTDAVDAFNHREMIFHKAVLPSSQFVTFLISDQNILNRDLLSSFMELLRFLLDIGPFHRPTLEFILASPIAMAYTSYLSFVKNSRLLWMIIENLRSSLDEWDEEGPEMVKYGKPILQALFSEGFQDTLEQLLKHVQLSWNGRNGLSEENIAKYRHHILYMLGSNQMSQ
ncbi:hypothetical protein BLNAU_22465 [Blattamonas nauphoetae]|uniref:Uncharacterized protein n=1 Tax=Blattamonas nauphoetae TaxID=2049346 RepID=A0ABQ9WSZ6_9EUKA|nr:hypothetical protein BLNAU_22465 [Blattamonas nauphoetae]